MFQRPDGSEGPNLGCFGFVVVALVTAHLAARFMCVAVIVLAFGADAYLVDGLRVADWKHSTLSDGSKQVFPWNVVLGVGTFFLWVQFVLGIEYTVGAIRHRIHRWRHLAVPTRRLRRSATPERPRTPIGVDTVVGDTTVTTEGAGQSVVGTVTDKAGNSVSNTVTGINIDKTAPIITAARKTGSEANANGWNKEDVTVVFTASDALSGGFSTPVDQVFGEGNNQTATATVTDLAGNSAAAILTGIKVDKTAPTLIGSRSGLAHAASHDGWNNTDVTVATSRFGSAPSLREGKGPPFRPLLEGIG